jgi:hypothetical protein
VSVRPQYTRVSVNGRGHNPARERVCRDEHGLRTPEAVPKLARDQLDRVVVARYVGAKRLHVALDVDAA